MAPMLYRFFALSPIEKDKVLFIGTHTDRLSDNFLLLFRRLEREYDLTIRFHFLERGKAKNAMREKFRYLRDAATAAYIICDNSNDFVACLGKRSGQKILQTWHGAGAFKRFGFSTVNLLHGNDLSSMRRFPSSAEYDLVTVSSPEVIWAYVEAMGKEKTPKVVQATGLSRTDVYYDAAYVSGCRERVHKLIPEARVRRILLYAPTFRGEVEKAKAPDRLDIPAFSAALGEEYVLLIKHHPYVKVRPEIPESCRGFAFDVSDTLTIEELLCAADICISDYSSLVFEYSLFEKPMLFFAYDINDYEDWRGFYYPYEEMTPGPVFCENEPMIAYIRDVEQCFDREKVRAFREKFMSACDGHATDRIMERFFGVELERFRRQAPLHEIELSKRLDEKNRAAACVIEPPENGRGNSETKG